MKGYFMKVTILNGNPKSEEIVFDNYLNELTNYLQQKNHHAVVFTLRDMNIIPCIGCFDCLVKTPGLCVSNDEASEILQNYINSDFVIFASPVLMGFTSALLKKAQEKLLPLGHPYFRFLNGETRHIKRYEKYPSIGLLLDKNKETDNEDINIISDIYKRDAINLYTSLCFVKYLSDPVKELENEISRI
jgi:multimeric flavodoxin WrbA